MHQPVDAQIVLRLLNRTGKEIVICKHKTLGRFSPVKVEDEGAQGADVAFNLCQRGNDRQLYEHLQPFLKNGRRSRRRMNSGDLGGE